MEKYKNTTIDSDPQGPSYLQLKQLFTELNQLHVPNFLQKQNQIISPQPQNEPQTQDNNQQDLSQFKYETLLVTNPEPHILILQLNRLKVHNSINHQMMQELENFWNKVAPQKWRCIILTGSGQKAFCAGADLKARKNLDTKTWKEQHRTLQKAMLAMDKCPIPIVAAVNGVAYGGGLELALACDFMYVVEKTTLALPEVKLGIMPGAIGTQNLPRACGLRRAKELILSGKPITPQQGYEWGIINKVCQRENLLEKTLEVARLIAKNAPLSVRNAKKATNNAIQPDVEKDYMYEVKQYQVLVDSKDRVEGINAFNEKRTPNFKGE